LGQEELACILFPIGGYTKEEIRRLAERYGLPVARKPDSEEICFIPTGHYRSFVAQRLPQQPGEIVDVCGRVLGQHPGIASYTIGQRRGLGLAVGEPLYVVGLDATANRVIVGPQRELMHDILWAERLSFVAGSPPQGEVPIEAKVRYRSEAAPATLRVTGDRAEVRFQQPQRAIAPGQAVVFYQGERILGGGIIQDSARSRV